jgi:dTDP-4-dehydrorhamnose reductase
LRILITGACGLLGAHLAARLAKRHEMTGTDRHPWWGEEPIRLLPGDLSTPGFIARTLEASRPEAVIHCAALANVDACEKSPELTSAVNAGVTREIARAVSPETLVVYVSTDGIFQGDRPLARESDLPCPRTVYGRSKLQGEWEVQLHARQHLIVRTNFYGWSSGRKPTFAEWLYRALELRQPITLFKDFFFTPLYVGDLVLALEALIAGGHRGVFHVGGSERVAKSDFGLEMARGAGFSTDQVRIGFLSDAPQLVQRPRDMSLDSARFVEKTGRRLPNVRQGLERFLKHKGRPLAERVQDSASAPSRPMELPA